MFSRTRAALIALLLLVAVGGALSWEFEKTEPESSQTVVPNFVEGECTSNGVTLVIDFGTDSNLDSIVRCAQNFEGSGWDLFAATEIEAIGTDAYPVGFVCRVENYPSSGQQDCADTPKYSEGSWGYYFVNGSGYWQVSGVGAAAREPECGYAEGWRFLLPGENIGELVPATLPKIVSCDG